MQDVHFKKGNTEKQKEAGKPNRQSNTGRRSRKSGFIQHLEVGAGLQKEGNQLH